MSSKPSARKQNTRKKKEKRTRANKKHTNACKIKTKEEGYERRSARTRFERKKKQKKKKNNTDDGNNTNGGFDATLVPFGV
ncbi:unnamed protein product [Bathycoccus prasinos]